MKVGFIGLGIMGKPMCKNLIKAGHSLFVNTHKQSVMDEMSSLGATACPNAKEVALNSEVVITMLPNSPQVRDVCLTILCYFLKVNNTFDFDRSMKYATTLEIGNHKEQ